MSASDGIQIGVAVVLTLTLGAVLWYAWEARKQASASIRMAAEMVEARHGDMLPVLDFVREYRRGPDLIEDAMRIKGGQFPETIHVRLRNIGVGPALDLRFQVQLPGNSPAGQRAGYVGVGENAQGELVATEDWHLHLEPVAEARKRLSVTYRDVYGRIYRSYREITFDQETGRDIIGPLFTETF